MESVGTGATRTVGTPEAETASGATTSAAQTAGAKIIVAAMTADNLRFI
jgi:hypothetical protein